MHLSEEHRKAPVCRICDGVDARCDGCQEVLEDVLAAVVLVEIILIAIPIESPPLPAPPAVAALPFFNPELPDNIGPMDKICRCKAYWLASPYCYPSLCQSPEIV